MKHSIILSVAIAALIMCTSIASAQFPYSETLSGDLSEPSAPSNLGALPLGTSTVTGTLDNSAGTDPDAFSFNVAAGHLLTKLEFTQLDDVGFGSGHFFAFSNSNTALNTGSADGNRYSSFVTDQTVGINILDGTVNTFGGTGGSGPLGAGTYNFWLQETNGSNQNYTVALTTTTAVPEPSSVVFMVGSAGLMLLRRRRNI